MRNLKNINLKSLIACKNNKSIVLCFKFKIKLIAKNIEIVKKAIYIIYTRQGWFSFVHMNIQN